MADFFKKATLKHLAMQVLYVIGSMANETHWERANIDVYALECPNYLDQGRNWSDMEMAFALLLLAQVP